jgi:hypothetical protein
VDSDAMACFCLCSRSRLRTHRLLLSTSSFRLDWVGGAASVVGSMRPAMVSAMLRRPGSGAKTDAGDAWLPEDQTRQVAALSVLIPVQDS